MPESSFTQRYGTSFTNIPGGRGKQVQDIPELQWDEFGQEAPQGQQVPGMPGPPESFEGYLAPDYSDRKRFEDHVMMELGKNPFELNPNDALEKADENLPELFHHFFGGRVTWRDRGRLTKEQKDAWSEVVKSYHAWVYERANMEKAVLTDRYNFMMNQFDNAARQYEANISRARKKRAEWEREQKAEKKASAAERLKRMQEIMKRTPQAKQETIKATDINAYQKQFDAIREEFGEAGDISKPTIEAFNAFARNKGLPELELVKTPAKKQYGGPERLPNFMRDWLKEDELEKMNLQVKQGTKKKRGGATGSWKEAPKGPKGHGKIVEKRQTPDGRIIALYEDGHKEFIQ